MAEVHLMGRGARIALIGRDGAVRYLDRDTLETLAQFSVDALDLVDGDSDREAVDEREDDGPLEDDDNDSAVDDMPCDGATEDGL